ncbi:hypothetical protein AZE42_04756 [Rhizopogon vesiculosus]|uniref:Smr domain-containing protein n=1 Tax=Rhizopogon vesiculosus TaxID=180088 RepID=A0A1J8PV84_9AGAM|nr:hypothetical protein AZE42_04756 [Rhizopogon vesiculosus]
MVLLDKEASAKIFQENNQRCRPGAVDLHGLYVTEAEFYFKRAVQQVRERGESSLRVIVGKDYYDGNNPKIKPAPHIVTPSILQQPLPPCPTHTYFPP